MAKEKTSSKTASSTLATTVRTALYSSRMILADAPALYHRRRSRAIGSEQSANILQAIIWRRASYSWRWRGSGANKTQHRPVADRPGAPVLI
jgi:hypothetical protein